jgi:predicted secreted protein
MAKAPGRLAVVSKNAVTLGGVRVMNIQVDNTPIDVTDQDSTGLQTLLAVASMRVLSFDVEGVYTNPTLRDIAMDPTASQTLSDMTFKFSDGTALKDTIGGTFFMASYKEGNDYKEATTFSASFTSSGTWTFS